MEVEHVSVTLVTMEICVKIASLATIMTVTPA